MIKTEKVNENFVRTYSDAGFYIHGGSPAGDYEDAIDRIDSGRAYTETDKKIPTEDPTDSEYAEAGKILLGE